MKKAILILTLISGLIYSCASEKTQKLFNTDNIRTQLFSINPQKENRIKGVRGGEFKIPAGAFEGTEPVTIEVKEIYAPIEILASGLTTESNGELLESGGMFYINAKRNGRELELLKPIDGSIPTEYINDSMKLFKGEVMDDGNVNWVEPQELKLDSSANDECIKAGQMLFWQNCSSCHAVSKQLTGPALAGADKRVTKGMYYEVVENPSKAAKKYPYFQKQIKDYGTLMTGFPQLEKKAIDCIIEYVNAAVKNPKLEIMPDSIRNRLWPQTEAILSPNNPCGYDTVYINSSLSDIDSNLFSQPESEVSQGIPDTIAIREASDLEVLRNGFNDGVYAEKGKYDFTIKTLGWFNIDAFVKGLPGTTNIDLKIDTDFENESILDIHVFMPSKKLLSVAQHRSYDGLFHFEKNEGKAPFFLNDEAIAIALTSKGDNAHYGITKFKITEKQTILIRIKKGAPEQIKDAIQKNQLDGIEIDPVSKERVITAIPCNQKSPQTTDSLPIKEMEPK
jgi:mono/diheme cytochrome c family protein